MIFLVRGKSTVIKQFGYKIKYTPGALYLTEVESSVTIIFIFPKFGAKLPMRSNKLSILA